MIAIRNRKMTLGGEPGRLVAVHVPARRRFVTGFDRPDGQGLHGYRGLWAPGWTVAADKGGAGVVSAGTNLIGNPGFESAGPGGLADWVEGGSGVDVVQAEDPHSGTFAARVTRPADPGTSFMYQTMTGTAIGLHRLTFWAHGDGTVDPLVWVRDIGSLTYILQTGTGGTGVEYQQTTLFVLTMSDRTQVGFTGVAASSAVTIDDVEFAEVDLSECLLLARTRARSVSAAVTASGGEWAGVVLAVDDPDAPQNLVAAVIDSFDGHKCKLVKCIDGDWSTLIDAPLPGGYVAGRTLSLTREQDTFSVWYGAAGSLAQVGTSQTIAGWTGRFSGLLATGPNSRFDDLVTR